jgi:hypothetical protein
VTCKLWVQNADWHTTIRADRGGVAGAGSSPPWSEEHCGADSSFSVEHHGWPFLQWFPIDPGGRQEPAAATSGWPS